MPKLAKTFAAAAAFCTVASAASAQSWGRPDLGRFDARAAQSPAERLVLCDLASYFATAPDLDAHRVYIQRDNYRFEPSFPLAITRGGEWHDEELERAYLRQLRAGQVSSQEVHALRQQYGTEMERAFRRANVGERRFFQSQASFCRDLVRSSWQSAWR